MKGEALEYGDIIHYVWSEDASDHSAAMVILTPGGLRNDMVVMLPLSDANYRFDMRATIVGKVAAMWRPCTSACPFNPDYEGVPS